MTYCIETLGVSKIFGGLTAVNDVSINVPENLIASIIGPNGAGKTTLFNCISGYYSPERGQIMFYGMPIQGLQTNNIARLGIARTYQNVRLFGNLTVIENILIGQEPLLQTNWVQSTLHTRRAVTEETEALAKGFRLLDYVGLKGKGNFLASNLPYGEQRKLEIARALASDPRLLLLDEPTAGMNPSESKSLTDFICKLRDDLGLTILLIEHDMKVVMKISDQISVLDYGIKIAEGRPQEIQANQRVIDAYLGIGGGMLVGQFQERKRRAYANR